VAHELLDSHYVGVGPGEKIQFLIAHSRHQQGGENCLLVSVAFFEYAVEFRLGVFGRTPVGFGLRVLKCLESGTGILDRQAAFVGQEIKEVPEDAYFKMDLLGVMTRPLCCWLLVYLLLAAL
jgi:hypothetical protein